MIYAHVVIPGAGLCNKLFPWARASVFCRDTGAILLAPQWMGLPRIGPWLFGERDKRLYYNFFVAGKSVGGLRRICVEKFFPHVSEKAADRIDASRLVVVDFAGSEEFFDPFMRERAFLVEKLWEITHERIRQGVKWQAGESYLGVHVRRGDFGRAGFAVTDEWYVAAVNRLLALPQARGCSYVRIFSDAHPDELDFLRRSFPKIRFEQNLRNNSLTDLWLMSRSKALVCTSHSTFSMWARFLGGMPTIWNASSKKTRDYTGGDMGSEMHFV